MQHILMSSPELIYKAHQVLGLIEEEDNIRKNTIYVHHYSAKGQYQLELTAGSRILPEMEIKINCTSTLEITFNPPTPQISFGNLKEEEEEDNITARNDVFCNCDEESDVNAIENKSRVVN